MCEICGRSSCTRSFHSLSEQEKCYSSNDEDYKDDCGDVIDEALSNCNSIEEAMQATISVGDKVRSKITGSDLAEAVIEDIEQTLYGDCGEYSDCYEASQSDIDELTAFLTQWIDKQNFRCWSVENIKEVPITDFIEATEIVEYFK